MPLYPGRVLDQVDAIRSRSQTLLSRFSLISATPLGIHDDCQRRNEICDSIIPWLVKICYVELRRYAGMKSY